MELRAEGAARFFLRKMKSSNIFYAVQKTDLTLEPGQLAVISGRSGSGKSTLLNMMCGLLKPSEGSVWADGLDLYSLGDGALSRLRNEKFGIIPQGGSGLGSLTILENVMAPALMYGKGKEIRKRAGDLLERFGIAHLSEAFPKELSGGELRRMAIARALILQPEVLFADEPTGDLDDENTALVLSVLRDAADKGAAVMLVTHEGSAAAYGDVLYAMHDGVLSRN